MPYLLAGLAMFFTALSYGVMVRNFPLAGSVYNYVGRGWNPHLGFIAGWTLTLDYILIPTVTAASSAIYAQQLFPNIPYWILLAFFSIGMGTGALISSEPFHFKDLSSLGAATSLAVFSYLGFDAITTLAEETNHPKRDIPKAIYLSVCIGALTMFLSGYIGMLVIPDWGKYIGDINWVNTTLFQVSKMTGGDFFSVFFTAGYLTELGVFNLVATAAGARLLYGMGRDTMLPKSIRQN
jgi:putrescine importer